MKQKITLRQISAVATLAAALLCAAPSFAACTSPTGNAGDVVYSSSSNVMAYCNGTNWTAMGSNSFVSFGTLTTGDFCTATSGTTISCTTATVNMATQATGILGVANGGTGLATITTNGIMYGQGTSAAIATAAGSQYNVFVAGSSGVPGFGQVNLAQSAAVTGILPAANGGTGVNNSNTITLGGNINTTGAITTAGAFTTSGAFALTLTTTGATNVTLPTSGTLVNTGVTTLSSLASIGTITTGVWNGTPVTVPYGGTGVTSLTAHGILLGNGTGNVNVLGVGATGTVLTGVSGANPAFSASPSLTNLTLAGAEMISFGTDYTTTGLQSDVSINTGSAIRYTGSGDATFYGIVAGTAGQVLIIHNASSNTLTLSQQSTSEATVANRIITGTGSDLPISANSSITLQYDGTAARWRTINISNAGTAIAAGTTGQLQFNNGFGVLAADSNLYWDNTNKLLEVGAGAANPVATTGTAAAVTVNVIPQAVTYTSVAASGGVTVNGGATGQLAYYSTASAISGGSPLYWDATNSRIGIGTATPSTTLGLAGTAAQTLGMERGATVGNNLTVKAGGGLSGGTNENGGNLILSSGISTGTGTSQIQFNVYPGTAGATTDNTAATKMTMSSAGIGIGTSSPATMLQIAGSITQSNAGEFYRGAYWNGSAWQYTDTSQPVFIIRTQGANITNLAFAPGGTAGGTPSINGNIYLDGSTGNVGIGSASPQSDLDVTGEIVSDALGTYGSVRMISGNYGVFFRNDGSNTYLLHTASGSQYGTWNNDRQITLPDASDEVYLSNNGGHVGIGTTNVSMPNTSKTPKLELYQTTGSPTIGSYVSVTTASNHIVFNNPNGEVGAINTTNSATSYATSSDRRVKENISPTKRGLAQLGQITVQDFNFIADANKERVQGFIAQDLYKIYPEAVTVGGDDPKEHPWSVDYGRLTPLLVKAIQELKSLFDGDHTEIAILKSDNDNLRAENAELRARADKFEAYMKARP